MASEGRSEATRERAQAGGLTEAPSVADVAAQAGTIISICPPEFATDVASLIGETGFTDTYVDANAIYPCLAGRCRRSFGNEDGFRSLDQGLEHAWSELTPDLPAQLERMASGSGPKAWRFAAEMREIAATFEGVGLPPGFHEAAAEIFDRLSVLRDQTDVSVSDAIGLL